MSEPRILVVEDEGIVARDLQDTLERLGYAVPAVASSGEEAVEKAAETHPDLVLMDIVLKGAMDGVEAADQIRSHFDIPVVYLTANSDEDILERAKITEPFGYILKPFQDRELHATVAMALHRYKAEKALQKSEEEARQWAQENALVAEVGRNLSSTLDCDEIERAVLRWVNRGFKGEVAALLLPVDSPAQQSWKLLVNASGVDAIAAARQLEEELLKGMQAVSDQLVQASEIEVIVNEKIIAERGVTDLDGSKLESCLCVPLIVGGEVIGMVGVGSVSPERFGNRNLGFLSAIANQAAVAINNTRLFQQTLLEKQRVEAILTNMADGLLMVDGHRRVVTINPALEQMLRLEAKEVLGRYPFEASSNSRLASLATLCTDLGPDSPGDAGGGEARMVERDVRLEAAAGRVVRVASSVVTDAAERYLGEVMVVHDVTRERELEQMKSEFLANASHELRTPLHSIKGFVKLLVDGQVPDPETQKEFLDIVNEQTEHLGSLVDNLLDVSRMDAGHLELRREPLSVGHVIHKTVQKLSNLAKDKGIEFRIDVPAPLPMIEGDEERLTQVLTNLLHNAIKFSPGGGEVTMRAEVKDHKLLAQVTDHGIGIPEEAIPNLFERFYRVDSSMTRNTGGSGLGLHISRQIIEAHGGRIWVESKVGEGSTFGVTLPLNISSNGATNQESPPDARQEGQPGERDMT